MKNKKRGGARKGAGRKKGKDNVIPINTWHKKSIVKLLGGKEKTKKKIYEAIDGLVLAVTPFEKK